MHPRIASLAKWAFKPPPTFNYIEQFLNARHALLWLSDTNSQSFNGQALRSETEINAFGFSMHLSIKRTVDGLNITLADNGPGKRVIDLPVRVTVAPQKICLNFDNLELNIELAAAPS